MVRVSIKSCQVVSIIKKSNVECDIITERLVSKPAEVILIEKKGGGGVLGEQMLQWYE